MNNKEKFLLELLNKADDVRVDSSDEDYFCFNPKGINFEVRIPYNQYSSIININFVLNSFGRSDNSQTGVSLTFSSINEAPTFMAEIYKRYEDYLNKHSQNTPFAQDTFNKIEEMFRTPINTYDYPYFVSGQSESLMIRDNEKPCGIQINLGESIYDYGQPISLNPLSFIVIECYNKDETTSYISRYKRIIPAFLIEQYPTISNVVNINQSTDNLHGLTDVLYQLDHNSGAVLTSMILDIELDNKNGTNKRNKL
jgi:hypothetical protein